MNDGIVLNELDISSFQLYKTSDSTISVPSGNAILLMVDRCVNGIEVIPRLKLSNQLMLYLPKMINVYNKSFRMSRDILKSAVRTNLEIAHRPEDIKRSFLFDISPYVSFLFAEFNQNRYPMEFFKFVNNAISSIRSNMVAGGIIKQWSILDVIDDSFVNNNRFTEKQLFSYAILNMLLRNDGKNDVPGNVDNIFLYHRSGGNDSARLIYRKSEPINYTSVRDSFLEIKPNLYIEQAKENEEQRNADQVVIPPSKEAVKDKRDNTITDFNKLATIMRTARETSSLQMSKQVDERIQKAIITKIDDEQFQQNREIPVVDDDNMKVFDETINRNNQKMFPYMNATKVRGNNITDLTALVRKDRSSDEHRLVKELIPMLTNDSTEAKKLYKKINTKLEQNPELLEKSLQLFEKKDFKQLMTFINEDTLPYSSRIYPKKEEVNRELLNEMDQWSEERGYNRAVPTDPVLNEGVLSSTIISNMHRVMAQKQLTWNSMPKEIEGYISKLLDDNGFQLVDVSMIDKEPPITQIEPTYKSDIRIRVRNRTTKVLQTLVFEVPTLIDEITAILSIEIC